MVDTQKVIETYTEWVQFEEMIARLLSLRTQQSKMPETDGMIWSEARFSSIDITQKRIYFVDDDFDTADVDLETFFNASDDKWREYVEKEDTEFYAACQAKAARHRQEFADSERARLRVLASTYPDVLKDYLQ